MTLEDYMYNLSKLTKTAYHMQDLKRPLKVTLVKSGYDKDHVTSAIIELIGTPSQYQVILPMIQYRGMIIFEGKSIKYLSERAINIYDLARDFLIKNGYVDNKWTDLHHESLL